MTYFLLNSIIPFSWMFFAIPTVTIIVYVIFATTMQKRQYNDYNVIMSIVLLLMIDMGTSITLQANVQKRMEEEGILELKKITNTTNVIYINSLETIKSDTTFQYKDVEIDYAKRDNFLILYGYGKNIYSDLSILHINNEFVICRQSRNKNEFEVSTLTKVESFKTYFDAVFYIQNLGECR